MKHASERRDKRAKQIAKWLNHHGAGVYPKATLMRWAELSPASPFKSHHRFANAIIALPKFISSNWDAVYHRGNLIFQRKGLNHHEQHS